MASGHVNRTSRPNTWQHRPSLRREDSSCQPGAVHTWHLADVNARAFDVRFQGMNGLRSIETRLIANAPLRKRFAFVAGNDG